MATHTLTTDQLLKLVDAMHGVVDKLSYTGDLGVAHAGGCVARNTPGTHTLTTAQLSGLIGMKDGGNDWPKHTDDPVVNYVVDCVMMYDNDPEDEEYAYDPALYRAEIEAWAAHFGT